MNVNSAGSDVVKKTEEKLQQLLGADSADPLKLLEVQKQLTQRDQLLKQEAADLALSGELVKKGALACPSPISTG